MAIFPELPPKLRPSLDQILPGFYSWYQDFKAFVQTKLTTINDFTVSTKGKGVILTNAAGTVTKRVRLNNAGTGFIFEDV